ncbi:Cysteine--tRNA ligase [Trichinella spiralis]|uniref:Cysteine--tRNA ligase n=1 Tax=Trichinella spiralis TaxID=6334 RepID=A0ABR3KJJ1_TRISP
MQVICASIDKCRFVEITLFANKSGQSKTEQTSEMKDMDTILLRVVVDDVGSPFNRCSNGRLLGEANVDQRLAAGVAYTNPLWGRVSVGVDSLKQAAYPMICTNGSLFHN